MCVCVCVFYQDLYKIEFLCCCGNCDAEKIYFPSGWLAEGKGAACKSENVKVYGLKCESWSGGWKIENFVGILRPAL